MDVETLLIATIHIIDQTEDDPEARQAALEYLAAHAEDEEEEQ